MYIEDFVLSKTTWGPSYIYIYIRRPRAAHDANSRRMAARRAALRRDAPPL